MKSKVIVLGLLIGLIFSFSVYAGNVVDNNSNHKGDILVGTGQNGWFGVSEGHWVDVNDLPEIQGINFRLMQNENDISGLEGDVNYLNNHATLDNRLGSGSENTTAPYGYNDYISENGFKNYMHNEGYSVVYDFDNPSLDLTPVGYFGKSGNPDSYDVDYVLTEEYKKYSSQYQDIRINKNRKHININKQKINQVDKKHTIWNKKQDRFIQKNKKQIKKVDKKHTVWNEAQDIDINQNSMDIINNSNRINNNTRKIDKLDNRVGELEETQYVVEGQIRIHDSKKWQVRPFARYNIGRSKVDTVGVKFTYKLGTSYEERRLNELDAKFQKLEKLILMSEVKVVCNDKGCEIVK